MEIEICKPADITLVVENMNFGVHKEILAEKSRYFGALFHGGFREANQSEIELKEISSKDFEVLLNYLYEGVINAHNLSENGLISAIQLASQLAVESLQQSLLESIIKEVLNMDNVIFFLSWSQFLTLPSLEEECLRLICIHSEWFLENKSFLSLSKSGAMKVFSADSFYVADEASIFQSICLWINEHRDEQEVDGLLSCVRLPPATKRNLLATEWFSDSFSPDLAPRIFKALKKNAEAGNKYGQRYKNAPEVDIATQYGNWRIKRYSCWKDSRGLKTTQFQDPHTFITSTTLELGAPSLINYIKLNFSGASSYASNFSVSLSSDKKEWHRVQPRETILGYKYWNIDLLEVFTEAPIITKYIQIDGLFNNVLEDDYVNIKEFNIECKYTTQLH